MLAVDCVAGLESRKWNSGAGGEDGMRDSFVGVGWGRKYWFSADALCWD